MDAKEKFSKAQGTQAKGTRIARFFLHLVAIPFTAWGFYQSTFGGTLAESTLWMAVLAVAVATLVRYLIGTQETSVARQLIWWGFPNAGAIASFAVSFCFLCGLIWYDHQTSQVGREAGIDEIVGEAELVSTYSIDSTREHHSSRYRSIFYADSVAAMENLAIQIEAHKAAKAAAMAEVTSMKKKAKSVSASHPSWAAGIRQNANKKEARANAKYNEALASSNLMTASTIRGYRLAMREDITLRDSLASADLLAIRYANEGTKDKHNKRKGKTQNAGYWIVIISSAGSFVLQLLYEGYRRITGLSMDGELYDPSEANKSPLRHLSGFVNDHIDVIDKRLAATREGYVKASEGKGAYQLPPVTKVLQFALFVGFAYSVGQTFVLTPEDYDATQQSMFSLPFPYNWVAMFVFGSSLLVAAWRNNWNDRLQVVSNKVEPVPEEDANLSEPVHDETDNTPETVVRQESQPMSDDEDNSVTIATPDEIRKAKDRCRKAYVRQFISATRAGQDSNADKFRQERKQLRLWGYKVRASGPIEKRNVKIEGKPEVVTFKRLIISE